MSLLMTRGNFKFGSTSYRRPKAALILTGDKSIDNLLEHMKTAVANRCARQGLSAACRVGAASIKPFVPSSMKDARKVIGFRVRMDRGGPHAGKTFAKFGFAVAKKQPPIKPRAGRRGVGISASNIHWWAEGTDQRFHKKDGHPTGRMLRDGRKPLEEAVQKGWRSAGGSVTAKLKETVKKAIDREISDFSKKVWK